jgi:phosphatidylserine decarboxylase
MIAIQHQFLERDTGRICTEHLFFDRAIRYLYSEAREKVPVLFRAITGPRTSSLLGFMNYDIPLMNGMQRYLARCGFDQAECLDPPHTLNTARKLFERRIRYWECRPMPQDSGAVVSPCDAKVIIGSLLDHSALFIKNKFFDLEELLGAGKAHWVKAFTDGDFAIFRLTPEKYHYNHTPVAGEVADFYAVTGAYHSCNPTAVLELGSPYSKNKRMVTIIDTDFPGGTGVGLVAMIEVVALMIGEVVQLYSESGYENPRLIAKGMFLEKGRPKSLFRPGSSTVVLLFEKDRATFAEDLVRNLGRTDVQSRFSVGLGRPLVETDLKVRSQVAGQLESWPGQSAREGLRNVE